MTQLTLPLHEMVALHAGTKTHLALLVQEQDVYEPLPDDAARILTRDGYCRVTTGDEIVMRDTTRQYVTSAHLTAITPTPRLLIEMRGAHALDFGYLSLCDLWHDWTKRCDPPAHRWWNVSHDLFQPAFKEKGFRKFLYTRNPAMYTAWDLIVAPVKTAAALESLTRLLQSVR